MIAESKLKVSKTRTLMSAEYNHSSAEEPPCNRLRTNASRSVTTDPPTRATPPTKPTLVLQYLRTATGSETISTGASTISESSRSHTVDSGLHACAGDG